MVYDIKLQKTFIYIFKCGSYCAGFEVGLAEDLSNPEIPAFPGEEN